MRWLDLFSGIGAYALGLEAAGHEVIGFCENDAWARKILKKHRPTKPISWCVKSLVEKLGESLVASPVKILASQERVPDLPESVRDSGGRCYEPFAWFDQGSQLWKTWQRCLVGGWGLYSEIWPKAGMIVSGVAYRLLNSEPLTCENESILLPTICTQGGTTVRSKTKRENGSQEQMQTRLYHSGYKKLFPNGRLPTLGANEGKGSSRDRYKGSPNFRGAKMSEGLRTTLDCPIYLNPSFGELVMGLPKDYTALETVTHPASSEN